MRVTNTMINDAMTGLRDVYVTDRKLAESMKARHLRGGKITKQDHRQLAGTAVYALGFDELGNMIYIAKDDGLIRQA